MEYLLIKENDVKLFKAFLSGNEIEVGVVVGPTADSIKPGHLLEIFYGNDYTGTYTAQVKRHHKAEYGARRDRSLLMISLVKV